MAIIMVLAHHYHKLKNPKFEGREEQILSANYIFKDVNYNSSKRLQDVEHLRLRMGILVLLEFSTFPLFSIYLLFSFISNKSNLD